MYIRIYIYIYIYVICINICTYIQMRCAQIRQRAFLKKLRIFEWGGLGKAEPPPGTRGKMRKRSTMCGSGWGGTLPRDTW